MMLSIGTFSRLSGLSIKALRLYDEIRILQPAEVDRRTGYRRYRLAQIAQAHRILALRQMGMSLGEVQRGRGGRSELLAAKQVLEGQMEVLAAQLATVNEALSAPDVGHPASAIAIKQVPATRVVAHRRAFADYDEADALLDELSEGQPFAVRGAVWHDCGTVTGHIDAEVFVMGSTRSEAELPAVSVASCLHGRGDDAVRSAYRGIRTWLRCSGYRRAGPFREIYFRIDGEGDFTEVQLPIVVSQENEK